jgi:hypothetical protein
MASSKDVKAAKKLLSSIGINKSSSQISKALNTVSKTSGGGSSSKSKSTPTPTPVTTPKEIGRSGSTIFYEGGTTSNDYKTTTPPAKDMNQARIDALGGKPAATTTTPTAGASIVPGKTVTGTYNGTQYYSDGTTSNDYKAGSTTAPAATPTTVTPAYDPNKVVATSPEDFKAKLDAMGITSSVPVREEIPTEPLPKPLAAQTYD